MRPDVEQWQVAFILYILCTSWVLRGEFRNRLRRGMDERKI